MPLPFQQPVMGLKSPTTTNLDEQREDHRDDAQTYHARRSAHLDLNLAVTKDETDGDDYYPNVKEEVETYQADMDIIGGEQHKSFLLTTSPRHVESTSHLQRSRSVSPPSRLSPSHGGGLFSLGRGQVGSSVDQHIDSSARISVRSPSPVRHRSPSPAKTPLQSDSDLRQYSLSPGKVLPMLPSSSRHPVTSPGRTVLQSPPLKRRRSPSSGHTSPSPFCGRHELTSPDPMASPSPVRLISPSPRRTQQRSPSPAKYRSPSPGRACQKSPSPLQYRLSSPGRTHKTSLSPVKQRSHFSRNDGSPSPARHGDPSARRYSPQHVKQRDISTSPRRHSPEDVKQRKRSPSPGRQSHRDVQERDILPPRRYSSQDVKQRDESPSQKRYSPQDVKQTDVSPSQRRYSPQDIKGRDGSPQIRYSTRDVKQRDRSPSFRRYSPRDVKQRDRSFSPLRQRSPRRYRSPPPRGKYSPEGIRQRRDRSLSRSPMRRKDGYGRSGRGYRARSRSPMPRNHYQRSPRARYSPRRRTSPMEYRSRRHSPRRRPWSPPPNRNTGLGKPGNNLFIAGFSFVTTERDLEKKFSRFGRVTDVRIVRDKLTGDSRGFGFLSLEKDEDADEAIRALDQTQWNGRIVLVEKSKTPAR